MIKSKVLIIGGGLSGLITAVELSSAGISVVLVEKKSYPFHKVCGEYLSNEILPYLQSLGMNPFDYGAKDIRRFSLSSTKGKSTHSKLPLGGFGISRYELDLRLYELALKKGVRFYLQDSILSVEQKEGLFYLQSQKGIDFQAEWVVGAQGKRSVIDRQLNREFMKARTAYMAVKCHYRGDFPEDSVALHNFRNGYCGLSKVETDAVNVCYLSKVSNLEEYGSIEAMEKELLSQNPFLKTVFQDWEPVFDKPLSISQIYFEPKPLLEQGVLMCGDAAGLIYPLCGNGMAMAIHGAKLLSTLLLAAAKGQLSREQLIQQYQQAWKRQFAGRLRMGRSFQRFFGQPWMSGFAVQGLKALPFLKQPIIRMTHGKTLKV